MSSLGKNVSANLLSNAWSTVLLLLLTPVYIQVLGVESYGLIGLFQTWLALLAILDTGISATAGRELAWRTHRDGERETIPSLLWSLEVVYWAIVLLIGLAVLAGAWVFGATWLGASALSPAVIRAALMLMAIALIVQTPSGLYIGGLMGLQRQVECSGLLALFGTLRGLGALAVLWAVAPDIRAFFVWQIVTSVAQALVLRWALWRRLSSVQGAPRAFSAPALHTIRAFAGGMLLISALGALLGQLDKLILSRLVSLEAFGFYMLGWAVASGLSRIATPLIQAFGPRFTELISREAWTALGSSVRVASQLMAVLILPPAATLAFLARPVLAVWTGNAAAAAATAPILSIVVIGTALTACSYPALSLLYSRKQLTPVIAVNAACVCLLVPALILSIRRYGTVGAAGCWMVYGVIVYVAYQAFGLRGVVGAGFVTVVLRDFAVPAIVSVAVAAASAYWLAEVANKIAFVILLGLSVVVAWGLALFACRDLSATVLDRVRWKPQLSL